MKNFKTTVLPILAATLWIGISEFFRNEFLLKSFWTVHYENMGLVFPSEPLNGAVWGLWSLCFSIGIYFIARKFTVLYSTLLVSFLGFVLM